MRIATADEVLETSCGLVKKPETVNYRTFKPEHDGLWCARIFGPTEDDECLCGRLKGEVHRGATCAKCGVTVGTKEVRHTRFGHIDLPVPVIHPFAYGEGRDHVARLLSLSSEDVANLAGWNHVRVDDPGETSFAVGAVLDEATVDDALMGYGEFGRSRGAVAVQNALADDETMVLSRLPVLPPGLRPMESLEDDRFQTHPVTDLYRRVVNRANRLKRLLELKAPVVITNTEARMLQEAVNALYDNGFHGKTITRPDGERMLCLRDLYEAEHGAMGADVLAGGELATARWMDAFALAAGGASEEEFD
ncbi:MAG: hypothetical protein AAGE52_31620 [Myxococcota bacterium]